MWLTSQLTYFLKILLYTTLSLAYHTHQRSQATFSAFFAHENDIRARKLPLFLTNVDEIQYTFIFKHRHDSLGHTPKNMVEANYLMHMFHKNSNRHLCLSNPVVRIRGGEVRRKARPDTGKVSDGISTFVEQLRSGQIKFDSNGSALDFNKFENVSTISQVRTAQEENNKVDAVPPGAFAANAIGQDRVVSLYERIGLRSSALEEKIGERIANETVSPILDQPDSEDDEISTEDDAENGPNFCDRIGILPKDDMETIRQKYMQHLISRGNELASQAGAADWLDTDDAALQAATAEGPGGDETGSLSAAGGAGGTPEFEWIDLESEVPAGREKAFVKAVCRQILFVRNLPKKTTPVRRHVGTRRSARPVPDAQDARHGAPR
jgi:hypothetical protein